MSVFVACIVPAGSSITNSALKKIGESLYGRRFEIAPTTQLFLSTKSTSIGKRIKNICTELHGLIIKHSPWRNSFFPKRPFALLKGVSAMATVSAIIEFLVLFLILIGRYYLQN